MALYSILRRHAKFNLLPNHQAADEELQAYHRPGYVTRSSRFRIFLEKHKHYRTCLLLIVLFAACMVISDGVFSPALSGKRSYENLYVFYLLFCTDVSIFFLLISQLIIGFFTVLSSFQGLKVHNKSLNHGEFVLIVNTHGQFPV